MEITINPKYEYMAEFVSSIPDNFNHLGKVIYDGRNVIRVISAPNGEIINVKKYHSPCGINAFVYSLGIRKAKGWRAYHFAQRLINMDINTPEPIAYIENRRCGIITDSYFISVQCQYEHLMYEMGNAPAEEYEPMSKALAQFTVMLHEKGVLHKDYSPGNILWRKDGDDYLFSIVDINRMQFGYVDMRTGCKNFARLWGPKRFLIMIVEEYARLRNLDVEECKSIMLHCRARFWRRFSLKHKVKFELEY